MRRQPKLDSNHNQTVSGLRAAGCSVLSLASLGNGAPDLLVGYKGQNWLIEMKDGKKPPSKRRLTADEVSFADRWRGQTAVAHSLDEALRVVGAVQ